MDKKVILLGTDWAKFPTFQYQCEEAFKKIGCKTSSLNYRAHRFHKNKITNKILNNHLAKKIIKENPDMLFVNKGESLEKGFIKKISKAGIKTTNWMLDEPFGKYHKPNKLTNIKEYDHFFIFDPYYLKELKKINPNSHYLPCAADPANVHKEMIPVKSRVYFSDITFIGSHLDDREEFFKHFTDYNLSLYGHRWNKVRGPLRSKVKGGTILGHEMAKQWNLSKININKHYEHSIYGVNLRTFEVPASNSFLLCDYYREIPKLFKLNKEIVCYKNLDEARELIDYYLDNERERLKIMKAGHKRVVKEHTLVHRMKDLMKKAK